MLVPNGVHYREVPLYMPLNLPLLQHRLCNALIMENILEEKVHITYTYNAIPVGKPQRLGFFRHVLNSQLLSTIAKIVYRRKRVFA